MRDGVPPSQMEKTVSALEEDVTRMWMKTDPLWEEAVEAIKEVDKDDLIQVGMYKRCPNLFLIVIGATIAAAFPDKKDGFEWSSVKSIVGDEDILQLLLSYDRNLALTTAAARAVTKAVNLPTFNATLWVEDKIPSADASRAGKAHKVSPSQPRIPCLARKHSTDHVVKHSTDLVVKHSTDLVVPARNAPGVRRVRQVGAGRGWLPRGVQAGDAPPG